MPNLTIIARISESLRDSLIQSVDFSDQRIKTVAILYTTAGFLHGVVDPGLSYIGIEILDQAYEANPIMRAPMQQGLGVFILIHIPLYIFVGTAHVLTIDFMTTEFEQGKQLTYYTALTGLSLIIGWGLWLNIWNIAVLLMTMWLPIHV